MRIFISYLVWCVAAEIKVARPASLAKPMEQPWRALENDWGVLYANRDVLFLGQLFAKLVGTNIEYSALGAQMLQDLYGAQGQAKLGRLLDPIIGLFHSGC